MSKSVRPLVFRTVDGKPVVPSWLRHGAQRIQPAPFMPAPPEQNLHDEREPDPLPPPPPSQPAHALRRSSLPPRFSAPPPPVVITRPPAAMSEPPPPAITPREQEEYARAALELASLRARVLAQSEGQLLELAVSIAQAIVEREIARDPALHDALARAAINALGDTRNAKLRVSRQAFRAITQVHGEGELDVDGVSVELVVDNSLEGFDVIAEGTASRVDGRIGERLSAVLRALEAEHRQSGSEEEV